MKKLVLIVIYFGKFPNYFQLWLNSCQKNNEVDWIIYTDNKEKYEYPRNVKKVYITFNEMYEKIQKKFTFKVSLQRAYKLCDYRPAYGYILEQEISNYIYWGHCDIDLIFGNLKKILNILDLNSFDRVLSKGHLLIYKNNYENNRLFMQKGEKFDYLDVFQQDISFGFDESKVLENILKKNGKKIYKNENLFIDIDYRYHNFYKKGEKNQYLDKFIYDNGKVFRYKKLDNEIIKEEYLYIHFQKRKIKLSYDKINFYQISNEITKVDDIYLRRNFTDKVLEKIMEILWKLKNIYLSRKYKKYILYKKVKNE